MSYLVLARKYRPQDFKSVTGQQHVTRTLSNAIKRDKVAHAYLFCGPRGVGKTSIARIFAKSLNCPQATDAEPCLKCTNCEEITSGKNLAVREIDGASHNSVENVRDLIDSFYSVPPPGNKYKIFIIDEVHMLSTSAFNALLKSLEEPPPNTVFILATTEPQKIPETVISRCQRFDLRSLPLADVEECLQSIVKDENLKIDNEVLRLIARLSEGSMRDAQSLLERVQSYCDDQVTLADASEALGVVSKPTLYNLSNAILNREVEAALQVVDRSFSTGLDPVLFLKEFVTHWRELMIAKFTGEDGLAKIGIIEDNQVEALRQVIGATQVDLLDLVQVARSGADTALRSNYTKYAIEALIIRMTVREPVEDIANLIKSISSGESRAIKKVSAPKKVEKKVEIKRVEKEQKQEKKLELEQVEKEPVQEQQPAVKQDLKWPEFISTVPADSQPMFVQHLKRLAVEEFNLGNFSVAAPEFTVKYFNMPANKKRLQGLLAEYSNHTAWNLNFKILKDEIAPGSILEQEATKKTKDQTERKEELLQHESVKNIQDIFPGSEVEAIRLKD